MMLCWLGLHDWLYLPLPDGEKRVCKKCAKLQKAHLYQLYGMYYVKWR